MMENCDMIRDLMPLYADGLASEASRKTVEEHTASCPACKKTLQEMCAPLEPELEDRVEQIMEMVYRKQRQKTVKHILSVIAVVLLLVWGFLELTHNSEVIYVSTNDADKILKEVPELALSDAELALVDTLFEIPEIQDALSDSYENSTTLSPTALMPYLSGICPEGGQITDVFVMGPSVTINIIVENRYICLTYSDDDRTGNIDFISKILAISRLDQLKDDGIIGKTKATYELYHPIGTNFEYYQKIKSRHMWFSYFDFWFDE